MKLIDCYVKEFGVLSNVSFSFNDGLNTILQDNGKGKSTLAAFIKAMFYGLNTTTKQSLDENARKKFTPWKGGRFGGYLDFELDSGKKYRIERYFENRNSSFKLYDLATNKESNDFTENIGLELFKIDEAAFERSTYYPQREVDFKSNETITAKLTSITYDNDVLSFSKANQALNKFRLSLTSTTYGKQKIAKAELGEISKKVVVSRDKRASYSEFDKQKKVCDKEIEELEQHLQELEKQKESLLSYSTQKEINEHYNSLEKEVEECEQQLSELISFFKGESVTNEKIKELNDKIINIKTAENMLKDKQKKESEELAKINTFFNNDDVCLQDFNELLNKQGGQNKKANPLFIVIASAFLLLAVVLFVVNVVAVAAISVVLALACFIIHFVKRNKSGEKEDGEIEEFLKKYFDDSISYEEKIRKVYSLLEKKQELSTASYIEEEDSLKNIKEEVDNYLSIFFEEDESSQDEKVRILEIKRNKKEELFNELTKRKEKLEIFSKQKNVEVKQVPQGSVEEVNANINLVKEKLNELISRSKGLENSLASCESFVEDYEYLVGLEEECQKNVEALTMSARAVEKTISFLNEAKEELDSKYLGKMKVGYEKYASFITDSVVSSAIFDNTLKPSFVCEGEIKELDYFSEGFKDIACLCSRLALVDAIFENEKPVLIFDDPFVNLDDNKLKKAKQLIKNVSNEYQIIHLVCHTSRQ